MMLPHFDCVRYVIDPMYNLFLGTAKHLMKNIWLDGDNPVVNRINLANIQSNLDSVKAPSSIGRMPRKIKNSHGGFTADQWKTWTTIFFSLWPLECVNSNRLGQFFSIPKKRRKHCKSQIHKQLLTHTCHYP